MTTAAFKVTQLLGYPSQNQLAIAIGVDRSYIARWKRRIPDSQKVKLIRLAAQNRKKVTLEQIEACES